MSLLSKIIFIDIIFSLNYIGMLKNRLYPSVWLVLLKKKKNRKLE